MLENTLVFANRWDKRKNLPPELKEKLEEIQEIRRSANSQLLEQYFREAMVLREVSEDVDKYGSNGFRELCECLGLETKVAKDRVEVALKFTSKEIQRFVKTANKCGELLTPPCLESLAILPASERSAVFKDWRERSLTPKNLQKVVLEVKKQIDNDGIDEPEPPKKKSKTPIQLVRSINKTCEVLAEYLQAFKKTKESDFDDDKGKGKVAIELMQLRITGLEPLIVELAKGFNADAGMTLDAVHSQAVPAPKESKPKLKVALDKEEPEAAADEVDAEEAEEVQDSEPNEAIAEINAKDDYVDYVEEGDEDDDVLDAEITSIVSDDDEDDDDDLDLESEFASMDSSEEDDEIAQSVVATVRKRGSKRKAKTTAVAEKPQTKGPGKYRARGK